MHQLALRQRPINRHLAGIDRAAAPEAHERIRIHALDFFLQLVDGAPGHMLHHAGKNRSAAAPSAPVTSIENRESAQRRHHDGAFQTPPFHLFFQCGHFTGPVNHAFEPRQIEFADRSLQRRFK